MCSVLEMDNTGELGRFRDFSNYHRLDSDDIDKLLIFCLLLSPDEINGKCIFQDDDMCGNSNNKFFELSAVNTRGGRKRLPKFKFSAKFPIGLHVILQIQIKKLENDCYLMWKIILTENPSRFNVEPLLK